MENRKNIVLLSTADWDNPFWTNKQHVACELAGLGYRIFYIDSLGLRQPSLGAKSDLGRIIRRLYKGLTPPKKVRENIYVWSPITIPFRKVPGISIINRIGFQVLYSIYSRLYGFGPGAWLWTYSPLTEQYLHLANFDKSIYHCVDEVKWQPGMPMELIESVEKRLCQNVDVIFTTSTELTTSRKVLNSNTHYFPNVADFDHFNRSVLPGEIPKDIDFDGLVVGFIGAISSYKINFELILKSAQKFTNVAFVLIGKIGEGDPKTTVDIFRNQANVHFLGPKDYNILPDYLRAIDVTIIPSQINEYTKNMFPMKFFEYLAAGKPVVTTRIPALEKYERYFFWAHDDEFINCLKAAFEVDNSFIQEGIELAKRNTYRSRTINMLKKVQEI